MNVSDPPVIISQEFPNSLAIVWDAITQHQQMKNWFFEQIPKFRAEVGFKTQFNVQAPSRDSFVIFELTEKNNSSKLTLITQVTEDFDDSIPEFRRESCVGGWNYFLKERLFNYLKQKND